jgi:hypothetical protein
VIRLRLRTRIAALLAVGALVASAGASIAHPTGIPALGTVAKNMQFANNIVTPGGNSLDFFERKASNGALTRYAVASTQTGFEIIDINDPAEPATVGRYVTAGFNYHSWVAVNPKRNIVAYSIESPGTSVSHGLSNGVEFVDIADVANPVLLGQVAGLGSGGVPGNGPHTIRMIGENHVYTTLPTHIIDYTDPRNPKDLGQPGNLCGHEFYPDPNIPGRTYVGICGNFKWAILDTTDPAKPKTITEVRDLDVAFGHEVYPSADSSFVGVTDYRIGPATGYSYLQCPGGGIHFYDISGKYVPGASLTSPKKMGAWFAPFNGAGADPGSTNPNWASCTTHSWQMQLERLLFTAGTYTAGSWVGDASAVTKKTGGLYSEWAGNPARGLGPTSWANTTGNYRAEGDFVNATQWLPFDVPADADAGKWVFTNGLVRGFDILKYTGPMPKKLSRLAVNASPVTGSVTGKLDRYAVLTYDGWVNLPLSGKAIEVTDGTTTVTAITGDDGTFSATGLPVTPGSLTVKWAGDDVFDAVSWSS